MSQKRTRTPGLYYAKTSYGCTLVRAHNIRQARNKVLAEMYAACGSSTGNRWVITAWDPCFRTWANPPVPCLHSDPQFPDCQPGQTQRLRGWLSFYEGEDLEAEFRRIEATGWRPD